MSGPKLSVAEIEAQRLAKLEQERQERLRRLRIAQDKYNNARISVNELKQQIEKLLVDNLESIRDVSPDGANKLSALVRTSLSLMNMKEVSNTASEESWIRSAEESLKRVKELSEKAIEEINLEIQRVGIHNAKAASSAKIEKASVTVDRTVIEKMAEKLDIDFHHHVKSNLKDLLEDHLKEIELIVAEDHGPLRKRIHELKNAMEEVIKELGTSAGTIPQSVIYSKVQTIINYKQDLLDEIEECKDLYATYCALAAIINTDPKPISDFDGVETLEDEIAKLDTQYQNKDEMDYIADQINQVMIELGYEFVSSHVLQQEEEKDVSIYGVDNQTGVVVYTGENGEVMMQVANLGDSEEMEEEEIEDNFEMQISFCAAHQDIVDALKKRGIMLQQKNYMPPHRSHAKKVCTNEFSHEKERTVTRRKRRYEHRKKMYKM